MCFILNSGILSCKRNDAIYFKGQETIGAIFLQCVCKLILLFASIPYDTMRVVDVIVPLAMMLLC